MPRTRDLVSIIVPVYGTEAYLSACVDSIRKQTYENLQIILVDDQSPDGCPEICDRYAEQDERITVIHQENKGVSGARNAGLRCAAGDYIMFVDSDDELYSDAVSILLQDAMAYTADIVWAPQKRVDKKRNITEGYEEGAYTVFQGDDALLLSLKGVHNTNAVWGKIFKADFIKGICFEEGQNINEDGFFMFQCYMRKPVLIRHNVSVYQYNTREGSCSRQKFSNKYLSMLYFCDKKKKIVSACWPEYIEEARNMEAITYLQMLDLLCTTVDRKYNDLQKQCVAMVRKLYRYHKPIHDHHKKLAWIVAHGLYPVYKAMVRLKYYR